MESLYAISIHDTMLFFAGNLTKQDCINIDKIAQNFIILNQSFNSHEEIIQVFISTIRRTLNISLSNIPIEHVFRIK